nr:hypothetical protein [Mycobacterium shottsii]
MLEGEVGGLAGAQFQCRFAQRRARGPLVDQVQRQHQQRVTGEYRHRYAVDHPRRRAMPPGYVTIHDVVVQQRTIVHQLDHYRSCNRGIHCPASCARAGNRQGRPNSLAMAHRTVAPIGFPPADMKPCAKPQRGREIIDHSSLLRFNKQSNIAQ